MTRGTPLRRLSRHFESPSRLQVTSFSTEYPAADAHVGSLVIVSPEPLTMTGQDVHGPSLIWYVRHRQRFRLVPFQPLLGLDPQVQFKLAVDPANAFMVPDRALHVAQVQKTQTKTQGPPVARQLHKPFGGSSRPFQNSRWSVDQLCGRIIGRERALCLEGFADDTAQSFNGHRGVDDLADCRIEGEIGDHLLPRSRPGQSD